LQGDSLTHCSVYQCIHKQKSNENEENCQLQDQWFDGAELKYKETQGEFIF